jgi:hypothetical protein
VRDAKHAIAMEVMSFVCMLGCGGVDATITLESGRTGTPLWWAARGMPSPDYDDKGELVGEEEEVETQMVESRLALAQLLVEKGADVNAIGKDGDGNPSTPLWWAARAVCVGREGGLALAQLLVKKSANVNTVGEDADGNPSIPLWWAARAVYHSREVGLVLAKLLVEKGADVNAVGKYENGNPSTPLWLAAQAANAGEEVGTVLVRLLNPRREGQPLSLILPFGEIP